MPQGETWDKLRLEIAPLSKKLIKKHRKLFFRYMSERYKVWQRRQAGKKPPWTKDEILQQYHFTNVFRIKDRGSEWLLMHIRPAYGELPRADGKKVSKKELVWRVVQYRWPNYHTLFESWGWIPRGFNRAKWLKNIEQTKAARGQWFTSAHIVLQSNFKQSRAENYLDYLGLLDNDFDNFYDGIVNATTMEEAFKHVKRFKGFGGFTAYEILIDLCYLGVLPDAFRDQFANAGPGASEGVRLIYPQAKSPKELTESMGRLRDFQDTAWERYGFAPTPRLTLQDIEFCLCEFSKYVKIMHGTGKRRRYRSRAV